MPLPVQSTCPAALNMTPLDTHFSSPDGVLRTAEHILASPGLTRSEFARGIGQQAPVENYLPDYALSGTVSMRLWGHRFVGGVRFFKDAIHGVTLTLEQSRVDALGYDATEQDLLAEKKTLTAILSKHLACAPSSTSLGADVFAFPWGAVIARADLKSTWCGIELRYV